MKNNRTFKMNGKTYTSMMDIARELGLKRVYPRDFAKLGIEEMTDVQDVQDVTSDNAETADVKTEDVKTEDVKTEDVKTDKRFTRKTGTDEQIKEAQSLAATVGVVEFNNYIKHFSVSALVKMAESVGVDTWDDIANEPIRRMRLFMEIKAYYYPNEKTPVKSVSGWKALSLNELIKIAEDNNLDFKTSTDDKIQRMWVTLALSKSGLNPLDFKPKKAQEEDVDA